MTAMDDFPIAPTLVIKDVPKPRHLKTLKEARDYVEEAMRIGRPEPWREVFRRLKAVTSEEDAIEAGRRPARTSRRRGFAAAVPRQSQSLDWRSKSRHRWARISDSPTAPPGSPRIALPSVNER